MKINLTCPINSLGYGVVSTNVTIALEAIGCEVALWVLGSPDVDSEDKAKTLRTMVSRAAFYDNTKPSLRIYHQFDLAQHVGKGIHCAMPIFELNKFTDQEIHHLRSQDLLFVASKWAEKVIRDNNINTPVVVTPFGVDKTTFYPSQSANKKTVFLNVGKWEVRKGHDVLIEAFDKAFGPTDEVELVMLSQNPVVRQNGEKYNSEWNNLYSNSKMGRAGKVRLLPRLKSQSQVADLMRQADCGVFPARAEGWNLELAEMLAIGKHCIATNYSGHTQFCTSANCRMVHTDTLSSAYDGVWFHGQGEWAELGPNQVEQLVQEMRKVHQEKQDGKLGVNVEGMKTFEELTWQNTAKLVVNGLSQFDRQ